MLKGIATLLRSHIEIRNRTWMKRVHRDCFIGSEAVDFLFSQGFLLLLLNFEIYLTVVYIDRFSRFKKRCNKYW